jgi:hypothetical protein
VSRTPGIWMETRCGSVASVTSPNWTMPTACHQTAYEGGFFSDIRRARKHFEKQGWKVIDDEWWCPVCAKILQGDRA